MQRPDLAWIPWRITGGRRGPDEPGRLLVVVLALAVAACTGTDGGAGVGADGADEYVVERSSEGDAEIVRSVSGSRWGGEGRLVEELSIGEDLGDDAYLFGAITAAWATDDHIYVVDSQVPTVRAFDHQGSYLYDIGRTGEGPGEYRTPMAMAVADDGRIFVTDLSGARMNVYDASGETIESWSLGSPMAALGLVLTLDGDLYTRVVQLPENREFTGSFDTRLGMQEVGPDGLEGEPLFPPPTEYEAPTVTIEARGNSLDMAIVPYEPSHQWAFTPGDAIVAGVGDEYRFEIHHPDATTTVVERYWDPVPVQAEEAAFRARAAAAGVQAFAPDFRMDPAIVPDHKPAFAGFRPDRSGRVWVQRQGPGRPDPECTELDSGSTITVSMRSSGGGGDVLVGGGSAGSSNEIEEDCWADTRLYDVFEIATGEFLGTVPAPEPGFQSLLFVEDDLALASVMDAMGTARLKVYRLQTD